MILKKLTKNEIAAEKMEKMFGNKYTLDNFFVNAKDAHLEDLNELPNIVKEEDSNIDYAFIANPDFTIKMFESLTDHKFKSSSSFVYGYADSISQIKKEYEDILCDPDRLFMFTVMPVEKEEFSSFRINRKGKYIGVKDIPKDAKTLDEVKDIDMVYTYLIYELEV